MTKALTAVLLTGLWVLGMVVLFTTPAWVPFQSQIFSGTRSLFFFWSWPVGATIWTALEISKRGQGNQPPPPSALSQLPEA